MSSCSIAVVRCIRPIQFDGLGVVTECLTPLPFFECCISLKSMPFRVAYIRPRFIAQSALKANESKHDFVI